MDIENNSSNRKALAKQVVSRMEEHELRESVEETLSYYYKINSGQFKAQWEKNFPSYTPENCAKLARRVVNCSSYDIQKAIQAEIFSTEYIKFLYENKQDAFEKDWDIFMNAKENV